VGIQIVHPIEEFGLAEWRKMLAIHLDGAFLTTKACLPHMYAGKRGGSVIYMGSVHSHVASMLKAPYVTAVQNVAEVALIFAAFPSNALTGQSLIVSHGWTMQ
jgi:3-hydroxybutyrate dehydrogenase